MTSRPTPCPVCGNRPSVVTRHERYYIHCKACGESGPVQSSRETAISAWDAVAKAAKR